MVIDATPWMLHNLRNRISLVDIPVKHGLDEVDRWFAHDPRDAELEVHDLINTVEGVFFVYQSVQQYAESPNILLFTAVGFALQNFGRRIVYDVQSLLVDSFQLERVSNFTNCPHEDIKRAILDVSCATKINELDIIFAIQNDIFIFDIPMYHQGLRMQMM